MISRPFISPNINPNPQTRRRKNPMERAPSSKKRRRESSSDPFEGICTRSRSEIFLHRNRSGQTRPDRQKHDVEIQIPRPRFSRRITRSNNAFEEDNSLISIKDLRTRRVRVLSPTSLEKIKVGTDTSQDKKPELIEIESEKADFDGKFCCQEKENEGKEGESGLDEECIQTTPPDNDILFKSVVEEVEGKTNGSGFDLPEADYMVENRSSTRVSGDDSCADLGFSSSMNDANSSSKKRLGLVPCSRLKLFRTPNSLGYRRLLPFLMDIAKDNSSALEIHSCQDYYPTKIEKNEERCVPPLLDSMSHNPEGRGNSNSLLVDLGTPSLEKLEEVTPVAASSGSPMFECTNLVCINQPITGTPIQNPPPNPDVLIQDQTISMRPNSFGESPSKPDQLMSDGSCKLDLVGHGAIGSVHEIEFPSGSAYSSPKSHECLPIEEYVYNNQHSSDLNPVLTEMERKEAMLDGKFCCQKLEDEREARASGLDEELYQSTPPDSDIFAKSVVEEVEGNIDMLGFDIPATDRVIENPSRTHVSGGDLCADEGSFSSKNDANASSENILGLVPCSRMKLFRTPNSLGYRRLLPFLMDLAKDNASALEIHSSQDYYPTKFEKNEQRPVPRLLYSVSHDPEGRGNLSTLLVDLGTPLEKLEEVVPVAGLPGSPIVECANPDSLEQPITETSIQNPDVSIHDTTISMRSNSYSENASQFDQIMSDDSCQLDIDGHDAVGSVHEMEFVSGSLSSSPISHEGLPTVNESEFVSASLSSSPISHEGLQMEEYAYNIQDFSNLPGRAEEDCKMLSSRLSSNPKPLEILNSHEHSSQLEVPLLLEKPILAPTKGILKRHPQGCKGLCTCPSCDSFRLNAEKAYEFSRKQMEEAKEVAMGLMKELSRFRSLVEKSIVPTVDGDTVKDYSVQLNQVKGLCRRASRAEELARNRLKKMALDLNICCRTSSLQRPRVRFADYVEERLIPKFGEE
ncbi:uncharacterized protein LOC143845552 isoform X2 [Tasmannia lanceolata]|uniref:uncharacterized protein LOC143845552 isoform X2 n=1 Tax=Tasmannia lanceolata TaxID=3420 RepID=UPI004062EDF8